MANTVPRKPELTLALIYQLIHGLEVNADEAGNISQTPLEELRRMERELRMAISQRTIKAGEAEKATQVLRETNKRATETAKRVRELLYSIYGKQDPRLLKYGLDTLKNRWDKRKR